MAVLVGRATPTSFQEPCEERHQALCAGVQAVLRDMIKKFPLLRFEEDRIVAWNMNYGPNLSLFDAASINVICAMTPKLASGWEGCSASGYFRHTDRNFPDVRKVALALVEGALDQVKRGCVYEPMTEKIIAQIPDIKDFQPQ